MSDFKARMSEELYQLDQKITTAFEAAYGEIRPEMSGPARALLVVQIQAMETYATVLQERIVLAELEAAEDK